MSLRVVRISEIATTREKKGLVPVSVATWWRWVAEGRAPKPFKLGPHVTVWNLDEIEAFLKERAAA